MIQKFVLIQEIKPQIYWILSQFLHSAFTKNNSNKIYKNKTIFCYCGHN